MPQAQFGPIPVPDGLPDDRYLYLSDVLPTAWQAVEYADIPADGMLAVFGLGPIGQMSGRIALQRGARVIGVDRVRARLEAARVAGMEVVDATSTDPVEAIREATAGRGADSVIDAVGMEAHGAPVVETAQRLLGSLPSFVAAPAMRRLGVDRLSVLSQCFDAVRRGGTVSIIGVYGGMLDPLAMLQLFDKGVQVRMGQAHVRRWIDDLMPYVNADDDPLGLDTFATHHLPLEQAPRAYEAFQKKEGDVLKVVLRPQAAR